MFVDFRDQPPPPPWTPPPGRPPLTPRQERLLGRLVMVFILLLFVAPIGGATILQALVALLH